MLKRRWMLGAAGAMAGLIFAQALLNADEAKKSKPARDTKAHQEHSAGDSKDATAPSEADLAKMMEAYAQAAAPGPEHQKLEVLAGSWDAVVKTFEKPDAPVEKKGSSECRMILGGRFFQEEFKGEMQGQPFAGMGVYGYDKAAQKYFCLWVDTMSTQYLALQGKSSNDGKSFTYKGQLKDPVTKQACEFRSKVLIADADHHHMEMYQVDKGAETKMMEIHYTRRK